MVNGRRGKGEGGISQRGDGRWVGRVDLGWIDGRRHVKAYYGATRRQVAEKLKVALRDQQQGLPLPDERQTTGRFLIQWLDDTARHSVRASTYDSYSRLIRKHVIPTLGRTALARLSAEDLASLYSDLLDKGLSGRTVQYAHAVIHRALKQAVRWNLIVRNPADAVDAPRPQLGRTSQGLAFSEPKTTRGRRSITLPKVAIETLRAHRAAQLEARLAVGSAWEDQDLIFANVVGRPLERQNVQRRSFKPLLRRAGLPDIRFHDLRHSAATLLLSLGEHPKVVQERLGHATIAITMDIYSHVMPDIQRDTATKLDAHFAVQKG